MQIHYRDEGIGPALILLHGSNSSLHTWEGWVNELKSSFRLISLDLPGYGLTGPHPHHDYSMETYIGILKNFTDRLSLERFSLAGNSFGGRVAWEFTLAYPNMIEKLILVCSSGYPSPLPRLYRLARNPLLKGFFNFITPKKIIENGIKNAYGDPTKVTPRLVEQYFELLLRVGNRRAMVAHMNKDEQWHHEEIKKISVPTLILWGEKDRLIPVRLSKRFHENIKGSKLIIYPGVGHLPMEEIPEKSAADAKGFLFKRS